jgi:hypothetical protein
MQRATRRPPAAHAHISCVALGFFPDFNAGLLGCLNHQRTTPTPPCPLAVADAARRHSLPINLSGRQRPPQFDFLADHLRNKNQKACEPKQSPPMRERLVRISWWNLREIRATEPYLIGDAPTSRWQAEAKAR